MLRLKGTIHDSFQLTHSVCATHSKTTFFFFLCFALTNNLRTDTIILPSSATYGVCHSKFTEAILLHDDTITIKQNHEWPSSIIIKSRN